MAVKPVVLAARAQEELAAQVLAHGHKRSGGRIYDRPVLMP